ncbi:MAG: translation elongation factor Ts [Alphaproteobacteria bacterium]
MAAITAALVKELREKSGAGMMDCKKALAENDGNMDAAVDWLRSKGLAAAAKKSGRVAAEGLVAIATEGNKGVVVEVNSETDFVARNDTFQNFASTAAQVALGGALDVEALGAADFPGAGKTVSEQLTEMVGTIGENMSLRRVSGLEVSEGVVAGYMHTAAAPGLGKIGVLVALESSGDTAVLEATGKQIAMHVAATNPMAVTTEEMDPEAVERERAVLVEQARESGKPDNIIEKMIEGRMRKFYEEVVLLKQAYVIDPDLTVEKALEAAGKEAGAPIKLTAIARFALGEGIEKKEEDFAAEVAAVAGS